LTEVRKSVEIVAPIAGVFSFAADWENWTRFFEGVSDFRPVTEITRGNGAIYAYKAKVLGLKMSVETAISDYVENEGWVGTSVRGLPHQTQWVFEYDGDKTTLTYVLGYRLPVPLVGSILDRLFVKPAWERIIEDSLKNLKSIMEGR
jgi:uncharacterized membrane protein